MMLPQEIIRAKRDGRPLSEAEIGEFIAGLTSRRGQRRPGRRLRHGGVLPRHEPGRARRADAGDDALRRDARLARDEAAGAGGRQAFDRRRRRQRLADAGADARRLRRLCADDLRARPRPHRRHARQARFDPRLRLAAGPRRCFAASSPRPAARSSARPPISPPPTGASTPSATSPRRSNRSPLITASILSKKLAAGLQALVMDVKTGSGAFMPTLEGARDLAESIAAVANGAGLPTVALITDMNEPLASAAGNAVEVLNAVDYLTGAKRDARLHAVTLALGAELLTLAGLARDRVAARAALERVAGQRRRGRALRAHGRRARRPGRSPRQGARAAAGGAGRRRRDAGARGLRAVDRRARGRPRRGRARRRPRARRPMRSIRRSA